MNPEMLLEHFDRISDTPDAIPQLRRFVLELAVRGKLVQQNDADDSASELVSTVRLERKRLIDRGVIKNGRVFPKVREAEKPYSIPCEWEWIHLGESLIMTNGRPFKPTDWRNTGLPIVRIQNLNNRNAPFNYCDESRVDPNHVIDSGSFLISWSGTPGTSFGAFIWDRGKAALNQHIFKCSQVGQAYDDRFLRIAVNGRLDEMISKAHGGVGLQHITKDKLYRAS